MCILYCTYYYNIRNFFSKFYSCLIKKVWDWKALKCWVRDQKWPGFSCRILKWLEMCRITTHGNITPAETFLDILFHFHKSFLFLNGANFRIKGSCCCCFHITQTYSMVWKSTNWLSHTPFDSKINGFKIFLEN